MKNREKNTLKIVIFSILIFSIFCLPFASSSFAYIQPSFFILRTIAAKNAKLEPTTGFTHKIRIYSSSGENTRTLIETMLITDRGTATIQIADEAGKSIRRTVRTILGNKESEMARPALYDLLYIKDGSSIFDHLKALKLPVHTENELYATRSQTGEGEPQQMYVPEKENAMVRYENKVAIVVGVPTDTQKGVPLAERLKSWNNTMQLWVEKDSLIPLKAVIPAQDLTRGYRMDYQMSQYQLYKNFLYPRVIQIFKDGVLWVKLETVEVNLGQKELPASKTTSDIISDSRDFLDLYLKLVR